MGLKGVSKSIGFRGPEKWDFVWLENLRMYANEGVTKIFLVPEVVAISSSDFFHAGTISVSQNDRLPLE